MPAMGAQTVAEDNFDIIPKPMENAHKRIYTIDFFPFHQRKAKNNASMANK